MNTAIALNRFGLGARADEDLPTDPKRWLFEQFGRFEIKPAAWASEPVSAAIAVNLADARQRNGTAEGSANTEARRSLRRTNSELYQGAVGARTMSALTTTAPFIERLVHFWSNHFSVSVDKALVLPFAGAFEAEAIRPHVLGRFEEMLLAVERHPAMLLYLDQVQSIGPDSRIAARLESRNPGREAGLNENLAREIMELHTLGVRTGYTQGDVSEFARALTGWSANLSGRGARVRRSPPGSFVFREAAHEPGIRTIMGKSYAQAGEAQGRAVLHDLAIAPATARHIAMKLARHFVADDPPVALVERLSNAFQRSSGNLSALYRALIDAPESWATPSVKFKTPWEWLVSMLRGLGQRDLRDMRIAPLMQQLGQPVWRPGSPAGFDDVAASWASPDALMRRVEVVQRIAGRAAERTDPHILAARLLPTALSANTTQALAHTKSLPTGLAMLFVSPEFLRR